MGTVRMETRTGAICLGTGTGTVHNTTVIVPDGAQKKLEDMDKSCPHSYKESNPESMSSSRRLW